jgi:hypothetical protein
MIAFEVLESPDANVRTQFRFYKNELYLGSKHGDLKINDSEILSSHVMIEIHEQDLLIHPQKGVEHFLLNGKRATTIRKLKKGDVISIGNTSFKIHDFSLTPDRSKKAVLSEKLNTLIESDSPRLIVIEKISELMK